MIERPLWLERLEAAWSRRSIVWLSGVRRVGKTTLARMLPDAEYFNCDLPSARRALADPELLFDQRPAGSRLVFDEIHRLDNPSELLKIAADEYPNLRILATGSSTMAATRKFRDALTGRKHTVHLPPVLWEECPDPFGLPDLDRRLLHGGLPDPLLDARKDPAFFSEWMDSFYARDIMELFDIRNRQGFLALFRTLLRQSGGQADYGRLASLCGVSRPTVMTHLEALQIAHAVHAVRPYYRGGKREIARRPKIYGFDIGFVTFEKGWDQLRSDDRGLLWEHLVLDALRFRHQDERIFYWRDKSGREVDFVIGRSRDRLDAVECKNNPDKLNPNAAAAFRKRYPEGDNYVVSPGATRPYRMRRGGMIWTVCTTRDLPHGNGAAERRCPRG